MKSTAFIFSMLISFPASSNDDICSSPEARQFDFWIGEWKVEWNDSAGNKLNGKNTITKILGNCVIEENFNGEPGIPFKGKSLSVYKPEKNKWLQIWVDNNGGYMLFEGEFKDEKMILLTERFDKDKNKILLRMVFYNIEHNSLDWDWQRSKDNGESWESLWLLHYTRLK